MSHSIRPGEVLAGRYRLVDLLIESEGGRFWRAYDRILERHVAIHVVAADDERAAGLLDAAKRSATVLDRRLLRVLDAAIDGGICFVVNEWGTGTSLDILLANDGPLPPRRAAWVAGEVADCIALAHAAGAAHGRMVPENVLIDRNGAVRIIGFAVDAALHGLAPAPTADRTPADVTDVTDVAGILYAALTGKWAGASTSAVPMAPQVHGRVLRPRQVRAGIPRPLDELCDEVLNPYAVARGRDAAGLSTARGIADQLAAFVGDATGMPEAMAASTPAAARDETVVIPAVPEVPARKQPTAEPELPTEAGLPVFDDDSDDVSWLAAPSRPAPPPPPFEEPPTRPLFAPEPEHGHPARRPRPLTPGAGDSGYWPWDHAPGSEAQEDSDDAEDDTTENPADGVPDTPRPPTRFRTARGIARPTGRTTAAVPPGAPTPQGTATTSAGASPSPTTPADRPAAASAGPQPATPATPLTAPPAAPPEARGGDTLRGTGSAAIEEEREPGRNWLRLAFVISTVLALLVAVVLAYNLGRGRTPLGALPDEDPTEDPTGDSGTPAARPIAGLVAADFDPQGDPSVENPDRAPLAVDGDETTAWPTETYVQDLGPLGLKTGVGLTVDLGRARQVASVDLVLVDGGADVSLYLTRSAPTAIRGLEPVETLRAGRQERVRLEPPAPGRYLTVWLTSLPAVDGGFRGEIAEVTVRG